MVNSDMDTASLIIVICVVIPAFIAIIVCAIVFYSKRNESRKFHQQRNTSYEYHHSHEGRLQDNHVIDFSHVYRYQQQRRLRETQSVFEQSLPSCDNYSTNQTRRIPLPLFSSIHTTPPTTHVNQVLPVIAPSTYETMPPSYAEIFLTPHILTNR